MTIQRVVGVTITHSYVTHLSHYCVQCTGCCGLWIVGNEHNMEHKLVAAACAVPGESVQMACDGARKERFNGSRYGIVGSGWKQRVVSGMWTQTPASDEWNLGQESRVVGAV
jgi:hypothetical protein